MAVKIKFDSDYNAQPPTLVLCTRNGTKLSPIPARNIKYAAQMNGYNQPIFIVNEYNNGVRYPCWDDLQNFKLVYAKEWNEFFEASIEISEKNERTKTCTCTSLGEAELSLIFLYDIEINTESDILRKDYVPTVLYDSDNPRASLLHRIKEKAPHYIIKHVDSSIKNIQRTFSFNKVSIYDAFKQISEEINCIFILHVGYDSAGKMVRSISVYDLESTCLDCGKRGEFVTQCDSCGSTNISTGYGEDTTIYVSTENLADDITYSSDTGSVKNVFKLIAGDDLMTATIANLNPTGDGYLWHISNETKADMSSELVGKVNEYDTSYVFYNSEYKTAFKDVSSPSINKNEAELPVSLLNAYNQLIIKYGTIASDINIELKKIDPIIFGYPDLMLYYYDTIDLALFLRDTMMPSASILPDTTAAHEAEKLTSQNLSSVSQQHLSASEQVANSSVLSMAKVLVDHRYQTKVVSSTLDTTDRFDEHGVKYYVWTGSFSVTNYSNEEDSATTNNISVRITESYADYIRQQMEKVMSASKPTDDATDIVALFKLDHSLTSESPFTNELKKYSLTRLHMLYDACQACLDVLIEQNVASIDDAAGLYEIMYVPYNEKLHLISDEMSFRESEISIVSGRYDNDKKLVSDGMQTLITKVREYIQDQLNFEKYLGEELWVEFAAYRREDTYENSNYISDGLNNSELFNNAKEFLNVAKKEIYKSSTQQHSISSSLHNLLVMKEFQSIVDKFELGNWIRVNVDNNVYRLRLIAYTIDFDNLGVLDVTFSDVTHLSDGYLDMEGILSQASSIAKSYSSIKRQAGQGEKSKDFLDDWVENGLQLTKTKIVDAADNQSFTLDRRGLWCKRYSDILDDYDDQQIRLINTGLYVTNDGWNTANTGIGQFTYWSPVTEQYETDYGVVAKTLIGNLIIGDTVGIYNEDKSIQLDRNGFRMTIKANKDQDAASNVFSIEKKIVDDLGNAETSSIISVDKEGNLVLSGSLMVQPSEKDPDTLDNYLDKIKSDTYTAITDIYGKLDGTGELIDGVIKRKYEELEKSYNAALESYKQDVAAYMQFDETGLTIGATSSPLKIHTSNSQMSFLYNEQVMAFMDYEYLSISNADISSTLKIGKFFFNPRDDGSMSLTWYG